MEYTKLLQKMLHQFEEKGFNPAGTNSQLLIDTIQEKVGAEAYFDIEDVVLEAFNENAFHGFLAGFRLAHVLITGAGEVILPEPDTYASISEN